MALHWNLEKVPDEFCWNEDESMNPTTHTLIWGMMAIDMNGITEENAVEVHRRFRILAQIYDEPAYKFTLEDLKNRVGLSTNVSTTTKAAFKKRVMLALDRVASDALRRERKE